MEVLNGKGIYLSQLTPWAVREKTTLAPAQRYRMNRNSLGGELAIGGNTYEWGIGVHAESDLEFEIGAGWAAFEATVGLDDAAGGAGSVVFALLGDGKELYRSPVIRGESPGPVLVRVPIRGVRRLTLRVLPTDDLDLGDLADWAAARLAR